MKHTRIAHAEISSNNSNRVDSLFDLLIEHCPQFKERRILAIEKAVEYVGKKKQDGWLDVELREELLYKRVGGELHLSVTVMWDEGRKIKPFSYDAWNNTWFIACRVSDINHHDTPKAIADLWYNFEKELDVLIAQKEASKKDNYIKELEAKVKILEKENESLSESLRELSPED